MNPRISERISFKKGVPKNRIVLDYAGFRTLDSVVRAKEVFQESKVTVISQQFHNERALFIADFKGLEAIGFNARDVGGDGGLTIKFRERLARIKMMIDLITGKKPKFLGEKENHRITKNLVYKLVNEVSEISRYLLHHTRHSASATHRRHRWTFLFDIRDYSLCR